MIFAAREVLRWALTTILILLSAAPAIAGQLTVAWDPNTEPNIAGYRIAYGTAPGVYTTTIDVGKVTSQTISGLTEGQRYYFVVYAYNTNGLVSPASTEVNGIVPCASSAVPNPGAFSATGGSGIAIVTAGACGWTATSSIGWLTVTGGASGSGNGTVSFSVAGNPLTALRAGLLTIGGQLVTVTQAGQTMNGAGQASLIWQNDASRQASVWHMGGAQGITMLGWDFLSSAGIPGWRIVASGDFNGDGHPDVVWQSDTARQASVWYLGGAQGNTMLGWAYLSSSGIAGWSIVGVGDFNGDGHPDLVWQNDMTRQVSVWYLGGAQGTTMLGWSYISASGIPGWSVVAIADFNRDGHPDVVWQNDSTRQISVWYMGGAQGDTILGWDFLSSGGVPGWTVAGAADFDGDGHADLVWQNDSTRQVSVWYLGGAQGNTFLGWNYLSGALPGWRAIVR